jgi:dTDP-glucose pyrophosphorylase
LLEALGAVDANGRGFVLVSESGNKLAGVLTDGDVRRALLQGAKATDKISAFMNAEPKSVIEGDLPKIKEILRMPGITFVPILNKSGQIVDVAFRDMQAPDAKTRENLVMIMAGGRGSRLGALTANRPKPLVDVCGEPMVGRVLESLRAHNFHHFIFSLNYLGDQLRDYFGDGSKHGVMIDYVEEKQPLGTAGSLSLLPERPDRPVLVINCDVLTGLDFSTLVDRHETDENVVATMAVRDYVVSLPFGTVQIDRGTIRQISEKPQFTYQVAAGIYVLSPAVFDYVEPDTYLDMPDLFERLISDGKQTRSHHINDYWFDFGTPEQIEEAVEYLQRRGLL